MRVMTDSFEEDVIDTLIQFTRNRVEVASISYLEFSEVEEVYPILTCFQKHITTAAQIFYGAGYPTHPTVLEESKSRITRTREEIEDILGYAIAPWTLRGSVRFKFSKLADEPGYGHVVMTLFVEIRTKSEEDEVLHRTRVSMPMTLKMEVEK